jgi:uncharacterized repeat protein (TIGR03803 family)
VRTFGLSALAIGLCAALLVGCGGSQPPISAPGAMPESHTVASSYQVLYSFKGPPDGESPFANLIDVNGTLYSTTGYGGASADGTVYTITTDGAEQVLYSFGVLPDGSRPNGGLIDVNGMLYGTTVNGGIGYLRGRSYGTIFTITPSGSEKVLHAFRDEPDGRHPGPAVIDVGGTLYGTTPEGGHSKGDNRKGDGTVFSITPSGAEKVLHSFGHGNDGSRPAGSLIDVGGTLYGTTANGGGYGSGTVFTITTSGAERVLYSFKGMPDGANPYAGLVDVDGTLYGTTYSGGAYYGDSKVACGAGCGTVYSITTSGNEKVLHSFGHGTDGMMPARSLIEVKGKLYGTTGFGGTHGLDAGTVFSISTSGKEKVLHNFGPSPDGSRPDASLINVGGTLYGTTIDGGTHHDGTVFALTP